MDANGNRKTLTDKHGTTSWLWDARNLLLSTTDTFGQTVGYTYYPAGNLRTLTYPGAYVVTYTWDAAERMKSVTPWTGGTWTYFYRANSQIEHIQNNNGTLTVYGYDIAGRLVDLWNKTPGGVTISRQQFTDLDQVGNIKTESLTHALATPAPPSFVNASFSAANRLQSINGSAATVDAGGRTLSRNHAVGG